MYTLTMEEEDFLYPVPITKFFSSMNDAMDCIEVSMRYGYRFVSLIYEKKVIA